MKAKFNILDTVTHILDKNKNTLLIVGVIERPQYYSYLCTTASDNEQEYFEEELIKY